MANYYVNNMLIYKHICYSILLLLLPYLAILHLVIMATNKYRSMCMYVCICICMYYIYTHVCSLKGNNGNNSNNL